MLKVQNHPEAQTEPPHYSPLADLNSRHPGWRIQVAQLADGAVEKIRPAERLILLDIGYYNADPELCAAHAVAHLDLHLEELPAWFSEEDCLCADFLAELRLDREDSRAEV